MRIVSFLVLVAVVAVDARTGNGRRDSVRVSYQPAFHGIPVYMAIELGWFDELGIDVEYSVVRF